MPASKLFSDFSFSKCGCCETPADELHNYGCKEKLGVFTVREQEVLKRIRDVKEQARHLKFRIRNLGRDQHDTPVLGQLTGGLAQLRRERAKLEEERLAAAEERMRRLGHA